VVALILRGFRLVPAEASASVFEDAVHRSSLSTGIYNVNTESSSTRTAAFPPISSRCSCFGRR
jgi:hypothetical protein